MVLGHSLSLVPAQIHIAKVLFLPYKSPSFFVQLYIYVLLHLLLKR